MKRKGIFAVIMGLVLALLLFVPGCANETEEETSLLLTLNTPLNWAGKDRLGTFYMFYEVAHAAASNNNFDNVYMFYGPEAVELIVEGYQDAQTLPPPLVEKFGGAETLGDASRLMVNDLGVVIYASAEALGQHQLTADDFVTPLDTAGYAKLLAEVDEANRW
jgi:predicted peroxiredoxin